MQDGAWFRAFRVARVWQMRTNKRRDMRTACNVRQMTAVRLQALTRGLAHMPQRPKQAARSATLNEQQNQTRVGVLATLRSRLINAELRPGTQLKAVELARIMRVSQTPIREALARLTGEGLLIDRPRQGYFVPTFSVELLTNLYDLSHVYLSAALVQRIDAVASDTALEDATRTQGERDDDPYGQFFASILERAENELLAARGAWPVARLRPVRLIEAVLLPQRPESELLALQEAMRSNPEEALALLGQYHDLRKAAVPKIARWLRKNIEGI